MSEILLMNYWEHIKAEKELARVLPPDHPQRIKLNEAAQEILDKINHRENSTIHKQ